jgi:hypothetical protein
MRVEDYPKVKQLIEQVWQKAEQLRQLDSNGIQVIIRNPALMNTVSTVGVDSPEHSFAPFAAGFIESIKQVLRAELVDLQAELDKY